MFFSDNIDDLQKFSFHNVICRSSTGRYCYGFLNPKNGNLSTGYEMEKNEDLSLILEKHIWSSIPIK